MKVKKEVLCAFYNQKVSGHNEYHKFMNTLVDNRKKLKPLYFENIDSKILIVFYKKKLKSIRKFISKDENGFLEHLLNGKHPYCSKCGCGYMTYYTYTYRDNCGCLGRSYECEVCQEYSDKAVREIRNYADKHGAKKTLLRLLNNKFFKEDAADDSEENEFYEDELPF